MRNAGRIAARFFGSIHKTLNHLIWADQMWLSRFGAIDAPEAKTITDGLTAYASFSEQQAARMQMDAVIEKWAAALTPEDLSGDMSFRSVSFNATFERPRSVLVMQIFNHQTHHRGQVHAMLTGFGVKTEVTDIPMRPEIWTGLT